MNLKQLTRVAVLAGLALIVTTSAAYSQPKGDIYTAVAAVKATSGAITETPMAFTIDRRMPKNEADALVAALRSGGAAGLRKALAGVAPTGTVRVGAAKPIASRLLFERQTGTSRVITIVTDQPVVLVGIGMPAATPKPGFDFAVVELLVDAKGSGTGSVAPAATLAVTQGMIAVAERAADVIRLSGVTKVR